MRSVWLCTRNDVIANIAVLVAAAGVFGTGTIWPDVAVAAILAVLGLSSGRIVIRQARAELATQQPKPPAPPPSCRSPGARAHGSEASSRPGCRRPTRSRRGCPGSSSTVSAHCRGALPCLARQHAEHMAVQVDRVVPRGAVHQLDHMRTGCASGAAAAACRASARAPACRSRSRTSPCARAWSGIAPIMPPPNTMRCALRAWPGRARRPGWPAAAAAAANDSRSGASVAVLDLQQLVRAIAVEVVDHAVRAPGRRAAIEDQVGAHARARAPRGPAQCGATGWPSSAMTRGSCPSKSRP